MKKHLLLALFASASVCSVASANTITFSEVPVFAAGGTTLFAGTEGEVKITHSGGNTGLFLGDATGIAVFPGGGNPPPFFSVDGTGFALFEYKQTQNYLSFDWGTEDNYNKVDFYLGGILVKTVTGSGNGTTASAFAMAGAFDAIKFYNQPTTNSFEIDNVRTSVPDGGATALMLGLALVGIGIFRQKAGLLG